jgi:TonB-dependent receptor
MIGTMLRSIPLALLLAASAGISAFAQNTAIISGTVRDVQTGEALPGGNVMLTGSGMGAITDNLGRYTVRNVPPGTYTLRVTYVGYTTGSAIVTVQGPSDVHKDFALRAVAIEGETVVVTAQAAGQNEAINRQLSSMPVMNAVSASRIRELPDANAAESVGRLPGVSLIRTGGEGARVVIRGLSPQYNQVTIEGVEMPGNVTSLNYLTSSVMSDQELQSNYLGDRAEDLSMISSSSLGGIEVVKAITPDMDATLIGGTVNFTLRKATSARSRQSRAAPDENATWIPGVEIKTQSGYNGLKKSRGDFKLSGSLEQRFFDQKFGVFIQGSTEQRNLSANELSVGYTLTDKSHGDAGIPDLSTLDLFDTFRIRKRFGGTVVLDYQHEGGEIGIMSMGSSSVTRTVCRGEYITPADNNVYFYGQETNGTLNTINTIVQVKQDISFLHAELKLSHGYSGSHDPEDLLFGFSQPDAGYAGMAASIIKQSPAVVASLLTPDLRKAPMRGVQTETFLTDERLLGADLDLQTDVRIVEGISATVKAGGMWQHRHRTHDYDLSEGNAWLDTRVTANIQRAYPWVTLTNGDIGFQNFVYNGYEYGNFFDGEYALAYPINVDLMWAYLPIFKRTFAEGSSVSGYQPRLLGSSLNDYDGTEDKSAGYAMVTLTLGDHLSLLPGVRYQNLTTTYSATRGVMLPGDKFQGGDTTVTQTHGYWLPMVHLRYSPLDWLQLHVAYTNTLNYPDHSAITPRYLIGNGFITYNNHRLKPATSENFDVVLTLHSNTIGLLTIDGFRKRVRDLIFFSKQYVTDLSPYPDLPPIGGSLYEFNTYINNPFTVDVYGVETEWQTHFWYLPRPLDGLVLNINYTHIFSEASYPKTERLVTYDEEGNAAYTTQDKPYTTRMLNQPNDIVNLTLGYDVMGFSARVSMLYQDNVFKLADFWMQNRVNSAPYTRWDLSVKQDLPWLGIQLFFNMNNITGESDVDVNQKTGFPANAKRYGMSADLGLSISL